MCRNHLTLSASTSIPNLPHLQASVRKKRKLERCTVLGLDNKKSVTSIIDYYTPEHNIAPYTHVSIVSYKSVVSPGGAPSGACGQGKLIDPAQLAKIINHLTSICIYNMQDHRLICYYATHDPSPNIEMPTSRNLRNLASSKHTNSTHNTL